MLTGRHLQLTLALIKPEACARPHVLRFIRSKLLANGFLVVRSRRVYLDRDQAGTFYEQHKNKYFYNRLVTYMSSGLIYSHVLARYDAINAWRRLLGPTRTFEAIHEAPRTIRGSFGLTDTRNCGHGSDSPESAKEEIRFFFPGFDTERWFKRDEFKFRRNLVEFDATNFLHKIKKRDTFNVYCS